MMKVTLLAALVAVTSVHAGQQRVHHNGKADAEERSNSALCDVVADVVVWGGTVCGLTASLAAAGQNVSVLWMVNGSRLGGAYTKLIQCNHTGTVQASLSDCTFAY